MQFGGINTGRYKAGAVPESSHIYGWPMNNYWVTNFNAEQHGGHTWVYSLSSAPDNLAGTASRFGWGNRTPFLARVIPGGGRGDASWQQSFIKNWPENLLLVSAMPSSDGKSALLHVREVDGTPATLTLQHGEKGTALKLMQTDVTGTEIQHGSLELKAFESKFFRLTF
jgi:alpha-mannosidase